MANHSQQPHDASDPLVLTPGGWRRRSQVHHVPEGHHVSGAEGILKIVHTQSGKVFRELGPMLREPQRKGDKVIPRVAEARRPKGMPAPAPITNGWIVNAEWTNNAATPISYFAARWIVPPAPATDNGQLIYLFNGLCQTSTGPFILQPVLQWGKSDAGGGDYWGIANWYVDGQGGLALHGNFQQVSTGDVVRGVMTMTGQNAGHFDYVSSFDGFSNLDFTITDIDELHWANITLECYNFKAFSDYPDTALTPFYDIELRLRTQTTPTVIDTDAAYNWAAHNRVTDNGQHELSVSNDSPGGDVYLYYRNVAQSLYFVTDKSTFGRDEVSDVIADSAGRFSEAFWVVLEGFTIDQLTIDQPAELGPALSGPFSALNGVSITPSSGGPEYELPGDRYTPQRIRFPFDVTFTVGSMSSFPVAGGAPLQEVLQAGITVGGVTLGASTVFELVGGADPYFTNVDPGQDNVFWLSQDLRVFTATPAINNTPVAGGPTFAADSVAGAYSYIQALLSHLNANYANPSATDPFVSLLPGQAGALTGDSSVVPCTIQSLFPLSLASNYNFAVARVRLRGTAGPAGAAQNVRVFFRLWTTQSADTDFDSGSTYLSNLDAQGLPTSPLPAPDSHTIPFFATGNTPSLNDPGNPEYGTGGVNNRTVEITSGDSTWAYFGCFLNVYDPGNVVNGSPVQALLNGTHHCLVAQIAYDGAPIVNAGGVTVSPGNSDKLAQRNLQMTYSGNPGRTDTHRIPQTFDLRPSGPVADAPGSLLDYPDELMIDWGDIPADSVASIYWPQVKSADVMALASRLYPQHRLSAPDDSTIQCPASGITYVPIPSGSGQGFAGLLTVDLPPRLMAGQEFDIIVRRIRTRRQEAIDRAVESDVRLRMAEPHRRWMHNWRYVTGTFQVRIPVTTKEVMLPLEENTLAILKWRLQAIAPTSRWYPVLRRYVQYIAARVDGLGGNSAAIEPSLQGAPIVGLPEDRHERTGKVCEVIFDCFGDFEGFVLESCGGRHYYSSHERGIAELVLRACHDRSRVSVRVDRHSERILAIVIRC